MVVHTREVAFRQVPRSLRMQLLDHSRATEQVEQEAVDLKSIDLGQ